MTIISIKLWLLVGIALGLSLLINALFIFKELIKRYPNIFTEEK